METERNIVMRDMQEMWTIVFQQGAFIALLPIEKLLKQLDDAKAALVFKNEVVRVQGIITTRKQNG